MTCPVCQDRGQAAKRCKRCQGWGKITIEGCALTLVSPDVWNALEAYTLVENFGAWPVAGGTLDQSESFLQAVATIRRLRAEYRNG